MSLGAALTEFITTDKLFSWKIDNFDSITKENLQELEYTEECFSMLYENRKQIVTRYNYLLKSPIMTSIHPNDGVKYTATLSLKYEDFLGMPTIVFESFPAIEKTRFFYHINDDIVMKEWTDEFEFDEDIKIKTLYICVQAVTKKCQTFEITPFKGSKNLGISERLKNMWKNDSSVQCFIKCGNKEIQAIKPFLAASSPVLNRMFESDMKEKSDNCVEIIEFNPEIVEKMIEFCESDDIKEYENCEEDLFKIAHKYEILVLMEFAVEKMAESLSFSNIEARLQIANLYDLKEFKKWCMQFVFRNNIEIEY